MMISLASFAVPFLAYLITNGFEILSAVLFALLVFEVRVIFGFAAHAWHRTKSAKDHSFIAVVCAILGMAALALALQLAESVACSLHPEFVILGVACRALSKPILLALMFGGFCFTTVSIAALAISLAIRRRYSLASDLMAIHLVAIFGSSTRSFNAVALSSLVVAVLELIGVGRGLGDVLFLMAFNFILLAVGLVISNTRLPRVAFEGRQRQRATQRLRAHT